MDSCWLLVECVLGGKFHVGGEVDAVLVTLIMMKLCLTYVITLSFTAPSIRTSVRALEPFTLCDFPQIRSLRGGKVLLARWAWFLNSSMDRGLFLHI